MTFGDTIELHDEYTCEGVWLSCSAKRIAPQSHQGILMSKVKAFGVI
jgi:hypothetical protein